MPRFARCTQELVCREKPLRGHLRPPRVPEECPASVKALVDDCTEAKTPALRPSAYDIFVRLANRRGRCLPGPALAVA